MEGSQSTNCSPVKRVLLVERNPLTRTILRSQFEELGVAVQVVSDGAAAWVSLSTTDFGLVVAERSAETSALIRRLRSEAGANRITPVVALTPRAEDTDLSLVRSEGYADVLHKPVANEALAAVFACFYHTGVPPENRHTSVDVPRAVWAGLLERAQGNVSLARLLLEKLLAELPRHLENIRAALRQGCLEEARHVAHTLHGAAAFCGVSDLEDAAKALESALPGDGRWEAPYACLEVAVTGFLSTQFELLAQAGGVVSAVATPATPLHRAP